MTGLSDSTTWIPSYHGHWNEGSSRSLGQRAGSPLTRASVCPGITVKDTSCKVSRLQGRVSMVSRPAILLGAPPPLELVLGPAASRSVCLPRRWGAEKQGGGARGGAVCKWTQEKGAVGQRKGRGSPISVTEVHVFKLNLTPLKAKGPCAGKVLHLGECRHCVPLQAWYPPDSRNTMPAPTPYKPTPLSSLTSVFSFSRSNMFSMSMKLV